MLVFQYITQLTLWQFVYHTIMCYYIVQLVRFAIAIGWILVRQFVLVSGDVRKRYSCGQGKQCWAVITGATDGIGLGFAQVFTRLGFDICLISRNQQKLTRTSHNLQTLRPQHFKHKQIITVQFDFTESHNKDKFLKMIEKVKGLDVGVLVNNVGTSEVREYEKLEYEEIQKIINVNCTSMVAMTQQLLPHLQQRNAKSAIINLSSFAGQSPLPYITLYSATKAMNTFFSQALSLENPNIDILSVRPMLVQSPLSRAKKGFNVPDRRECAWACVKEMRWVYETNGYWMHSVCAVFHQLFVPNFLHRVVSKIAIYPRIVEFNQ